ncbi:MAG TPA: hypothetical protein VEX70_04315 [Pyrinomonadaceae bacterium]|nr:hypothetical protein [Pyrinomonadaceae bacterium]
MRTLILACFFISFGSVTHAQEPQAFPVPPGVTVVKHGWSKERIDWEFNPSRGSYGSADVRGPLNIHSQIAERERAVRSRPPRPRYAFLYSATFRNGGAKAIKAIAWDCVFFDAGTGEELGRRRFADARTIAPGKTRKVARLLASPPTHRISVYALGERERDGLRGQVIITRVSYADGTEWRGGSPVNVLVRDK